MCTHMLQRSNAAKCRSFTKFPVQRNNLRERYLSDVEKHIFVVRLSQWHPRLVICHCTLVDNILIIINIIIIITVLLLLSTLSFYFLLPLLIIITIMFVAQKVSRFRVACANYYNVTSCIRSVRETFEHGLMFNERIYESSC